MNLEKLCLDIATTEDGDDVKKILEKYSLWDNTNNWKAVGFGEEYNNSSIIGNQQSNPANALVEKLVNCGDSALVLRCREEGINPYGENAPKNVKEAMQKFFGVLDGKWMNLQPKERTNLAEIYCNLIATGEKGAGANPTYTILDKGEGQHPEDFTKTFMSLIVKNKVGINFVQGKFGMGSFGAVNFCKKYGLQLIISKKNPSLVEVGQKNDWGFTVVRKIPPSKYQRCSQWQYLVVNDQIPSFFKDDLKLYPGEYPLAYGGEFRFGSFVKLYNYEIGASLRANIVFDLNFRINSLLVNPVVPVKFHERREGFKGNSFAVTLDGLETRLERDRKNVVEDGFPSHFSFNVRDQNFQGNIYAFKKYSDFENKIKTDTSKYANGVIFTINGQTNGSLNRGFFGQGKLKYENISKNLLVIIDCSNVDSEHIEQIFKNDRERISQEEIVKEIKMAIADILEKHSGIRKFQNEWKSSQIREIQDNQNTKELFEKLISKNKNLTNYFLKGNKIDAPFSKEEGEKEKYIGEYWPDFFETKKKHTKDNPREAEKGRSYRINLLTNAQNDYFSRSQNQGSWKIFRFNEDITYKSGVQLSGFDGKWTLTLPEIETELQHYRLEVSDIKKYNNPIICEFFLKLQDKKDRPNSESNNKKNKSVQFNLPKIIPLTMDDFDEYEIDEMDILFVNQTMDDNEFYLNMDNRHIQNYYKTLKDTEADYAKEQYKLSASMLGLVLIDQYKKDYPEESQVDNIPTIIEYSKRYTRTFAPIHMPFIRDVADVIDSK